MPAGSITPLTLPPPPDMPGMPEVGPALAGYLRKFALWCRNGFSATAESHRVCLVFCCRPTTRRPGRRRQYSCFR